ncbi:MAG: ATP-binding protein [Verrucomicrobiota bacterium]|nr:ATP-binding protein [Verrucomicrobiota bacterium]
MLFFSGPRQVGKTTSSLVNTSLAYYLNWDNEVHRAILLAGPEAVAKHFGLPSLTRPLVVFDEIHKYRHWKRFLKGFFDTYEKELQIIVTGSARLDVYKRDGDSMMGRYFLYRLHPLSLRELINPALPDTEITPPLPCNEFNTLLHYGGFPEPFLQKNDRFLHQWQRLRLELLFREDLRDLTRIQDIGQVEILAHRLIAQVGQQVDYTSLASAVKVAVPTVQRWMKALRELYFCFTLQPWSRNVSKSLIKQPKVYLWDWAMCQSKGARNENFVASHLLKAVQFWTDLGLGQYDLYYLRDKLKREVDFLVTKNGEPWFLVEAKTKDQGISSSLYHFQKETGAKHAFQITFDLPFVDIDCFQRRDPVVVPAETFLSQLV